MLERGNGVPSRARVLWANLSAQGARVRERWLTRPLAPCSQLKAHSREREIGSQDCYSNMVEQCLTMFCCETLEYDTFCRETLKYDTFCRKNLDSALWAKRNGKFAVRADSTFYATLFRSPLCVDFPVVFSPLLHLHWFLSKRGYCATVVTSYYQCLRKTSLDITAGSLM